MTSIGPLDLRWGAKRRLELHVDRRGPGAWRTNIEGDSHNEIVVSRRGERWHAFHRPKVSEPGAVVWSGSGPNAQAALDALYGRLSTAYHALECAVGRGTL